jgi:riboflavin-specific deaminase-like protein
MRVISNTAISLDGRINTTEGRFTTLGSERDHRRMSELRRQADAVLVGGATFRKWPHPSLPEGFDADAEEAAGRPRQKWNVIVTRTLDLPLSREYLTERRVRPLVLCPAAAAPPDFPVEVEAFPGAGPGARPGDGRDLPVPFLLDALRRRGVGTLLIEAGGDLLFQFLRAGVLDEMYVTLCPLLIGGRDAPSLVMDREGGPGFTLAEAQARRLHLLSAEVEGSEVFLHYSTQTPAPPGILPV